MGAHAEVQLILEDHHKAEGAHAGLIAITAGKEETVAFFEVIVDFLNFAHEKVLRNGVRGGGCTGFSYVFEWADEVRPTDKEFTAFGAGIVVDPKSFVYLAGLQLDFIRGMMGHGFKFNNPNAKGACGCGESVQF